MLAISQSIHPYLSFYMYLLHLPVSVCPDAGAASCGAGFSVRRGLAADAHNSECVRAIGGFEPIRCIKQLLVQLIRAKAGTVSHDGQPVA